MPATARDIELGFNLYQLPCRAKIKLKPASAPSFRIHGNEKANEQLKAESSGTPSSSVGFTFCNPQREQDLQELSLNDSPAPSSAATAVPRRQFPFSQLPGRRRTPKELYPLALAEKVNGEDFYASSPSAHDLSSAGTKTNSGLHLNRGICSSCSPSPFPLLNKKNTRNLLGPKNSLHPVKPPSSMVGSSAGEEENGRHHVDVPLTSSGSKAIGKCAIGKVPHMTGAKEISRHLECISNSDGGKRKGYFFGGSALAKAREQALADMREGHVFSPLVLPCSLLLHGNAKAKDDVFQMNPEIPGKQVGSDLLVLEEGSAGTEEDGSAVSSSFCALDLDKERKVEDGLATKKSVECVPSVQKSWNSLQNINDDENFQGVSSEFEGPPFATVLRYLLDVSYQLLTPEAVMFLEKVDKAVQGEILEKGHSLLQHFPLLQNEQDTSAKELALALAEAAQATGKQGVISSLDHLVSRHCSFPHIVMDSFNQTGQLTDDHRRKANMLEKESPELFATLHSDHHQTHHPAMCIALAAWAEYKLEQIFASDLLISTHVAMKKTDKMKDKKSSLAGNKNVVGNAKIEEDEKEELKKKRLVEQCFHLLDQAIEEGHIGAMFFVGCCLRDGKGLATNLSAGVSWIEQAATAGYVPAIHEMGEMIETGVERNDQELDSDWGEAMIWYSRAAKMNFSPSQLNLGKLLLAASMQSTTENTWTTEERETMNKKARYWLSFAAASGNLEALRLLDRLSN